MNAINEAMKNGYVPSNKAINSYRLFLLSKPIKDTYTAWKDWEKNQSTCYDCGKITEELFIDNGKELCEVCIEWKYNQ